MVVHRSMWNLCIFLVLSISTERVGSKKLNVLFIVSDDMRPQLGCYEGENFPSPVHPKTHTPSLDDLAKRSLLLKKAYVQEAVCSPSRTALLTGRRPDTSHVYDLIHYFRKVGGNFTTLPQYFKENGYDTIGMGKIFHPGQASGGDDPISWSEPYFHGKNNFESVQRSWQAIPDALLKDRPLVDQQLLKHGVATLRRVAQSDRPFFVAVGFHKPHLPFVFPESFLQYYPAENIKLPPNPYAPVNMPEAAWYDFSGLRNYGDIKALNSSGAINTTFPNSTVLDLRRAYYSALSYTDSLVGGLIKELNVLGLSKNTIVSFWGDHGWQLGEHGEWCKQTNFELATHAPMMIHIPGMTDGGIVTEQLTEFVDLFPTLVDAAGLPSLDLCPKDSKNVKICREGTSLLPLINNPDVPLKTAAFSQYPRNIQPKGVDVPIKTMGYTMRTVQYRYTEWAEFDYYPAYKPHWDKLHGVELYDHNVDPEENYNRALDQAYQSICKQLSTMLHNGWRNATLT